jgi:SAM-dependent methyltransferase
VERSAEPGVGGRCRAACTGRGAGPGQPALTFPVGAFDLISAQYLHSPVELPRDRVLQAALAALAPDGLLLIVDHGSVRPWGWKRHSHHPRFPAPEEVLDGLDLDPGRCRAEILDSPERQAAGPDGQKATVTDNVIAVRRLAR